MHIPNRARVLLGAALLLLITVTTVALWPNGMISVNFVNAPLRRVVAELQSQGRVTIRTDVKPETLVTLQLQHVTLLDALETLAVRVDADLRAASVVAPSAASARDLFGQLPSNIGTPEVSVSWFPGPMLPTPAGILDTRRLQVALEPTTHLQDALNQVAQKSGILIASPADWNPTLTMPTGTLPAIDALTKVAKASGGHVAAGFLLIAQRRDSEEGRGERGEGRRGFASFSEPWQIQRTNAAIAQLPPEAQPAARAEAEASQAFWQMVQALPENERREKIREYFNSPEMQERMNEREASRDARRTPEQRADRYKQYVERKRAASQQ